jgi:hypothetical protein
MVGPFRARAWTKLWPKLSFDDVSEGFSSSAVVGDSISQLYDVQ